MPSLHRYKCLNPNCPSMTKQAKAMTFTAMNQQPSCPHCGARKLQDWGEAINIGGISDNSKNSDKNFRQIADRYGLTDMNNKDGQAVKGARSAPPLVKGEKMVKVGGFSVPESQAMTGACVNDRSAAKQLKADLNGVPKTTAMLKGMTRVVAEHKQ